MSRKVFIYQEAFFADFEAFSTDNGDDFKCYAIMKLWLGCAIYRLEWQFSYTGDSEQGSHYNLAFASYPLLPFTIP
jgi:hypothetical protein